MKRWCIKGRIVSVSRGFVLSLGVCTDYSIRGSWRKGKEGIDGERMRRNKIIRIIRNPQHMIFPLPPHTDTSFKPSSIAGLMHCARALYCIVRHASGRSESCSSVVGIWENILLRVSIFVYLSLNLKCVISVVSVLRIRLLGWPGCLPGCPAAGFLRG